MATLGELAQQLGAELQGDPHCEILRVATLHNAGEGDITFLANSAYRKHLGATHASAVIVSSSDRAAVPCHALVVDNPHVSYARAAALLYPLPTAVPGRHPSAVVDVQSHVDPTASIGANVVIEAGAQIGPRAVIGPGCVVGCNAVVGADTRLVANVTICHGVVLGARCLLHPGAVIGSDGFGLANDRGRWEKIPQVGRVVVGDDVEIGANTCIDRGAIEDTVIEEGVKLDNLVHLAHNVRIGAHSAIAGCVGIAGSTVVGKHCTMGGGVCISGHLELADNVHLTGMSMVTKSIREPGVYSSGMPAEPNARWHKSAVRYRQLDEMARRLRALEKKLDNSSNDG